MNRLPTIGCESFYQSSIINHQPSIINHQSSIINHQPSTINHKPSILNPQSPIINHQLSITNHQPFFHLILQRVSLKGRSRAHSQRNPEAKKGSPHRKSKVGLAMGPVSDLELLKLLGVGPRAAPREEDPLRLCLHWKEALKAGKLGKPIPWFALLRVKLLLHIVLVGVVGPYLLREQQVLCQLLPLLALPRSTAGGRLQWPLYVFRQVGMVRECWGRWSRCALWPSILNHQSSIIKSSIINDQSSCCHQSIMNHHGANQDAVCTCSRARRRKKDQEGGREKREV